MSSTGKGSLRGIIELDSQIEMEPKLWRDGGFISSTRSTLVFILTAALANIATILVCPNISMLWLGVAALAAYLHTEVMEQGASMWSSRGDLENAKKLSL